MTRDLLVVVASFDERGGLQLRWRRLAHGFSTSRKVTVLTWAPGWRWRSRDEDGYRVVVAPSIAAWDRDRSAASEAANTVVSVLTGVITALVLRRRWGAAIGAGLHPEGTVAGISARLRGMPFFSEIWLVGPVGNVERLRRSFLRRPVIWLLSRARGVFSATGAGSAELASIGIPADRVVRESLHVDSRRFAPPSAQAREAGRRLLDARGPHTIVYAGRFDLRQKRLDLLIEAWERVHAPDWELILVGEGSGRAALEELLGSTGSNIRLHGWVDDVAAALKGADAFVLPTRFESPGYALLEAMACGLPGVVSAIDVYEDMRPDGVELVPNTVEAWSEALTRLTRADAADRAELGARCRRWIEDNASVPALDVLAAIIDR